MTLHALLKADSFLAIRERQKKRAAFAGRRFCQDAASVFLRDQLHDGQAYAGAFVLLGIVQPLEETEELLLLVGVEADSVVLYPEHTFGRCLLSPDVDSRSWGMAGELEGIIEQIDQGLTDADRFAIQIGEGEIDRDLRCGCR